jgi:DNA repair exonuclease SbcCD ATPase subunit
MPDSLIEKNLTVNGAPHHHLITIRGAHTQTPKVECYLEINGVPQLDRSTFDEMFAKCEQLYGSYTDYLLTTFYVQPLQGKTGSSLMSATMTDIRDLVQTIAGIDREAQKRQALDTASAIEKQLAEKESWVSGAVSNAVDTAALVEKRKALMTQEAVQQNYLISVTDSGKSKKTELATLIETQRKTTAERERKKGDDLLYSGATNKIEMLTNEIKAISELSNKLHDNLPALAADDTRLIRMQKRQEIINANMTKQNQYDKLKNEYDKKLSDKQLEIRIKNNEASNKYGADLRFYHSKKLEYESVITTFEHPCEQCGKIPYADAEKKIAHAKTELAKLVEPVKNQVVALVWTELPPIVPTIETVPDLEPCSINRAQLESDIETGRKAKATIEANDKQLLELKEQVRVLAEKIYDIDETIDAAVTAAETKLEQLRTEHGTARQTIAGIQAEAASITAQLEIAEAKSREIDAARAEIVTLSGTLGRWKYIAVQLRSEKIPAMELDLVLDLIDIEATRNLSPYQDGAYTFQTRTQRVGKKDVVDAFDITVHDARTGREKSFLAFSPGQKAFLNDAYVKALIRIRNQRAHITYSPIISDEADSPIEIPMIPTFYAMQERYYSREKVLVISHTPDARNYIANRIQIKELIV